MFSLQHQQDYLKFMFPDLYSLSTICNKQLENKQQQNHHYPHEYLKFAMTDQQQQHVAKELEQVQEEVVKDDENLKSVESSNWCHPQQQQQQQQYSQGQLLQQPQQQFRNIGICDRIR